MWKTTLEILLLQLTEIKCLSWSTVLKLQNKKNNWIRNVAWIHRNINILKMTEAHNLQN